MKIVKSLDADENTSENGLGCFKFLKPEEKGISSRDIKNYIEFLEDHGLSTHNVIISVDDSIVYENYWEPFEHDKPHRMYSVTKSFVAIAIGFLEQDRLLNLDDPVGKYFSEEIKSQKDLNMHKLTIKDMLMMSTSKAYQDWFVADTDDRVKFYFENDSEYSRPGGTIFQYDSTGSFVLGALAERLTGKTLMDYLREKFLNKIGFSKDAFCLKCPGGHSWGDSGLCCTPRDLLLVTRFIINMGCWNGEQILNEEFVRDATAALIDNNEPGTNDCNRQGYGYYIWKSRDDSFMFYGMGGQAALCYPDKKLILIYNGDNQGKPNAQAIILDGFHYMIAKNMSDKPLTNNNDEYNKLVEYSKGLKLAVSLGKKYSEYADEINGKSYKTDNNPMDISSFKIIFDDNSGKFIYVKDNKTKEITFGMGENLSGIFPEEGYSDEVGGKYAPGSFYKYMASASWVEDRKLNIKVHIIDKYLAQFNIVIGFKGDEVGMYMFAAAENFLRDYNGYTGGHLMKN